MNSICGSVVDRGVVGIKGSLGGEEAGGGGGGGGRGGRRGSATHFGDFTGFEASPSPLKLQLRKE